MTGKGPKANTPRYYKKLQRNRERYYKKSLGKLKEKPKVRELLQQARQEERDQVVRGMLQGRFKTLVKSKVRELVGVAFDS